MSSAVKLNCGRSTRDGCRWSTQRGHRVEFLDRLLLEIWCGRVSPKCLLFGSMYVQEFVFKQAVEFTSVVIAASPLRALLKRLGTR